MRNCPNCSLLIQDPATTHCPRCGQLLPGTESQGLGSFGQAPAQLYDAQTQLSSQSFPSGPGSWPGGQYGATAYGQGTPPATTGYSGSGSSPFSAYGTNVPPPPPSGYEPGVPPPPPTGYSQGGFPGTPPVPPPPVWSAPPAPFPPPAPPRKSRTGLIVGIVALIFVLLVGGTAIALFASKGSGGQTSNNQTPTATATTAPTPTPTPGETVFFQDPLTSNTNGWASDEHCFFQKNAYHIKDGYLCYAPIGQVSNGTITVDAKQVSGTPYWFYGIVLRRESKGNYYVFDIDSNGKWLFGKTVNDDYSDILPYQPSSAIKTGINVVNTLTVRASGSHFEFYVNGTKVGQADDTTFSSGSCGVHGDPNIEVAFNNFKVTLPIA